MRIVSEVWALVHPSDAGSTGWIGAALAPRCDGQATDKPGDPAKLSFMGPIFMATSRLVGMVAFWLGSGTPESPGVLTKLRHDGA